MKPHAERFRPLLRPLWLSGVFIAAGAAVLTASLQSRADARQASAAAESRLALLEARYQQSLETKRLTQDALTSWDQYLKGGLPPEPDRVFWIEGIQTLSTSPGIEVTDYEFSPAVALGEVRANMPPPLVKLMPLHIRARVAHEDKFIELLSTIKRIGRATVDECSLSFSEKEEATAHPLMAECRFGVLFLQPPPG